MNNLFDRCSSLISLPDISKWNVSNVIDMENMFSNCSSLKSLPDITKWNPLKLKNMSNMFYGCSSIKTLPDLSKLNNDNLLKTKKNKREKFMKKVIIYLEKFIIIKEYITRV